MIIYINNDEQSPKLIAREISYDALVMIIFLRNSYQFSMVIAKFS